MVRRKNKIDFREDASELCNPATKAVKFTSLKQLDDTLSTTEAIEDNS